MKRYPKLAPQLDHVMDDQRRLLGGDGGGRRARRGRARHALEAEIRW